MDYPQLINGYWFLTMNLGKYFHGDYRAGCIKHFITYVEKGTATFESKDITIKVKQGDLFYIPKGLPYQSFWKSDNEIQHKSFGFDVFPEACNKNYILQKINCSEKIIEQIKNFPTNPQITSRILAQFYDIVANILPVLEQDNYDQNKRIFETAKRYIYENPDLSAPEIAKRCMISESALYKIFKKEGTTPNLIRQKSLCEKAVLLLYTTDKSVQEISEILGFSSTSYFRKQLIKHIGKTPREIRKENSYLL